jgi:hypothetical protein
MKIKKCFLGLTLMIFVILTIGITPLLAINGKANLATLRGLKGVGVIIENLPSEVEKAGLLKNQLQVEVEFKLRSAGIKVLTREECAKTPGEPYLYINININTSKTESNLYPYTVDAMLIQKVMLVRDPDNVSYAVTWSIGGVGSVDKSILSNLRANVEEVVDKFINAFLSENQR